MAAAPVDTSSAAHKYAKRNHLVEAVSASNVAFKYGYCFVQGVAAGTLDAAAAVFDDQLASSAEDGVSFPVGDFIGDEEALPASRPGAPTATRKLVPRGLLLQCRWLGDAEAAKLGQDMEHSVSTSGRHPLVVAWQSSPDFYAGCHSEASKLGPFCQWRSCLAPALKATHPRYKPPSFAAPGLTPGFEDLADRQALPPPSSVVGSTSKYRQFCEPHARLKAMLEAAGDGGATGGKAALNVEVSRYLPREWTTAGGSKKRSGGGASAGAGGGTAAADGTSGGAGPAEPILTFPKMPSSSWLLHELRSKKLSTTLRAFYHRVASNARDTSEKPAIVSAKEKAGAKARADVSSHKGVGTVTGLCAPDDPGGVLAMGVTVGPAATTKKVQSLEHTASLLEWELKVAKKVRTVEAAASKELRRLAELEVYPFDELAAIRCDSVVGVCLFVCLLSCLGNSLCGWLTLRGLCPCVLASTATSLTCLTKSAAPF